MTFRDLMALFYGMPEALNQMRDHLRNFTRQRVLPSGGDFSDPSVRQGIMTLVSQALPLLQSAAVSKDGKLLEFLLIDSLLPFLFQNRILIFSCELRRKQVYVPMWILSPQWRSLSSSVFMKWSN